MDIKMTIGSLFDGSGGFPLGGRLCGMETLWTSEVAPFPLLVEHKNFPDAIHYGDVSKLDGAELKPVDIITFGSPCQDLSIAGNRAGIMLEGGRSNLFFEAIRIIKEMREKTNGEYPKYAIWENVQGALSSNKGEDFRAVIEQFASVCEPEVRIPRPSKGAWPHCGEIVGDQWSVAWRLFDAQFHGVPQRRQRIYLVGDFTGGSAGEIQFVSESLSGDSEPCFKPWKGSAACSGENSQGTDSQTGSGGKIKKRFMAFGVCSKSSNSMRSDNPNSGFYEAKTSRTLDQRGGDPTCNQGGIVVCENVKTFDIRFTSEGTKNARGHCYETETSRCLQTGSQDPNGNHGGVAIIEKAYGIGRPGFTSGQKANFHFAVNEELAPTLIESGPCAVCYKCGEEEMLERTNVYALQGSMIGRDNKNGPQGSGINEDVSFTLNTVDHHAVAYGLRMPHCEENGAVISSITGSFNGIGVDVANTLMSRDWKDPQLVYGKITNYIVRKLTPTECARLQGFPDDWTDDLAIPNPTDEQLSYWLDVWKAWNDMNGKKAKTPKQVKKWLENPTTDSELYKLWGNGVALPNVYYVMSGILWNEWRKGNDKDNRGHGT